MAARVPYTMRCPPALFKKLKRAAAANHRSANKQLTHLIDSVEEDVAKVETPKKQKRNIRAGAHRDDNLALKDGFRSNAQPAREGTPAESDKNESMVAKRYFRERDSAGTMKLKNSFKSGQDARLGF